MSDTIWVRRKSRVGTDESGDDFDHSLFCKLSEELDSLAESIGVRPLSDFFDTTDLQYNFSEEDLPETWIAENEKWFSPADALPALRKVIERLKSGEVKGVKEKVRADLVEELEDCLEKVTQAEHENDQFHFCIVM
ncbi:MAG: hypothetical protein V4812_14635 [Pseudomonadota bacterium]